MMGNDHLHCVSNGKQTRDAWDGMRKGGDLISTLAMWHQEDDSNDTPRITGACEHITGGTKFSLAMLRGSRWGAGCERLQWIYENMPDGLGMFLSTYSGDGKPLPPFVGEPWLMPLTGDINHVAGAYEGALDDEWPNFVALAVKFIPLNGGTSIVVTRNKYPEVC